MPIVTWDHVHLRSPDPEATAAWLENILGGVIIRSPGRIDVKLGGADVFIAPVAPNDGVNAPPTTPYQGLDHFGLAVKDIDAVAAEMPKSSQRAWSSLWSRPPSGPVYVSALSEVRRASPSNFWSVTRSTSEPLRRVLSPGRSLRAQPTYPLTLGATRPRIPVPL